jgi:hypothetical protein
MMITLAALNRWKASGLHLALSATIGIAVVALMLLVWYPWPLFEAAGGSELVLLLIGVDVVLGPLLTLILFKPGKPGLKFDLALIAAIQFSALAYGASVMFEARPVFMVFNVDRFTLTTSGQIPEGALARSPPPYDTLTLGGPRTVAARLPTDPQGKSKLMDYVLAGLDVPQLPEYFVAYDTLASAAAARARPIDELMKRHPQAAPELRQLAAAHAPGTLRWLPLRAPVRDMSVLIDGSSGVVVRVVPLAPW